MALVGDGRLSFSELATRCHISRSTAHARVERLRRIGAITGFTATLDPAVLGYGICALVFLKITQHGWRAARDSIAEVPGVESLMMCAGEYDLIAVVRSPDMSHFPRHLALPVARHRRRRRIVDGLRPRRGAPTVHPVATATSPTFAPGSVQ